MNAILDRIDNKLQHVARGLRTPWTDDALSEMRLAVLSAKPGHTDAFYIRHAKNRAQDWIKSERRRERLPVRERLTWRARATLDAVRVEFAPRPGVTWHFVTLGAVRTASDDQSASQRVKELL